MDKSHVMAVAPLLTEWELAPYDLRPLAVLDRAISLTSPFHQYRVSVTLEDGEWRAWCDLLKPDHVSRVVIRST